MLLWWQVSQVCEERDIVRIIATPGDAPYLPEKETAKHLVINDMAWRLVSKKGAAQRAVGYHW